MANYSNDKAFTDYVHNNIALSKIYQPINWLPFKLDEQKAKEIDMFKGIDYVFTCNGNYKTVQERFRESKYQQYTDFTIRYRRDGNMNAERRESEYYKMKADYFVYGITNCLKENITQCKDFIKYAIIDLKTVYAKIDNGDIIIKDNRQNKCSLNGSVIECPVKYNIDGSSSFFPIEISMLVKLWGNQIIVAQKGFI